MRTRTSRRIPTSSGTSALRLCENPAERDEQHFDYPLIPQAATRTGSRKEDQLMYTIWVAVAVGRPASVQVAVTA